MTRPAPDRIENLRVSAGDAARSCSADHDTSSHAITFQIAKNNTWRAMKNGVLRYGAFHSSIASPRTASSCDQW
jgi:hypothetical protein